MHTEMYCRSTHVKIFSWNGPWFLRQFCPFQKLDFPPRFPQNEKKWVNSVCQERSLDLLLGGVWRLAHSFSGRQTAATAAPDRKRLQFSSPKFSVDKLRGERERRRTLSYKHSLLSREPGPFLFPPSLFYDSSPHKLSSFFALSLHLLFLPPAVFLWWQKKSFSSLSFILCLFPFSNFWRRCCSYLRKKNPSPKRKPPWKAKMSEEGKHRAYFSLHNFQVQP